MSDGYRLEDIKAELAKDIPGVLNTLGIDLPAKSKRATYYHNGVLNSKSF